LEHKLQLFGDYFLVRSEVREKAEKEKRDLAAQVHRTAVERLQKLQGS